MTTKGPYRKQIIVPISQDNINTVIIYANKHIFNINKLLKSIKSDVIVMTWQKQLSYYLYGVFIQVFSLA